MHAGKSRDRQNAAAFSSSCASSLSAADPARDQQGHLNMVRSIHFGAFGTRYNIGHPHRRRTRASALNAGSDKMQRINKDVSVALSKVVENKRDR